MSSQINSQIASVERLIIPSATGLANNVSPSLPPTKGSVAVDPLDAYHLYMGNGTYWSNVSGGISDSTGVVVPNLTLSLGGQPSFTGCSLTLQMISNGAAGVANQVILSLSINSTITATAAGDWSSIAGVIPLAYRPPSGALYFPCIAFGAGQVNTWFEINSSASGSIIVHNPTASGTVGFYTVSCVYNI